MFQLEHSAQVQEALSRPYIQPQIASMFQLEHTATMFQLEHFVHTMPRVRVFYVRGRNRRKLFDVLIEQPMLAGIDDEGDIDALHDDGDPQRI
jgi:hypothetical protein